MVNSKQPPTPRKKRKIPHLMLYFLATALIKIYRLDCSGLRLV